MVLFGDDGMNMKRRELLIASGLGLLFSGLPRVAVAACTAAGGSAGLGAFLLQPCFKRLVVRRQPTDAVGPNGEARRNIDDPLILQEQAVGRDWIRYGKLYGDVGAIATGWKVLDWGLARQRADGGFDSKDALHQTTWFLEALTTAIAFDPTGQTTARRTGLSAGLAWIEAPAQRRRLTETSVTFTHRNWMRASLFRASSEILGRADLAALSEDCVKQAMAQQTDGAFLERGGSDVGYQILSLQYLQHWLALEPGGALSARAEASMVAGLNWYLARVNQDGRVDRTGSTRMLIETNQDDIQKDVRYARAIEVFLGASLLTGDPQWTRAAARLERGAITEGQAKPEALDRFEPQGDGQPSADVQGNCSLCTAG